MAAKLSVLCDGVTFRFFLLGASSVLNPIPSMPGSQNQKLNCVLLARYVSSMQSCSDVASTADPKPNGSDCGLIKHISMQQMQLKRAYVCCKLEQATNESNHSWFAHCGPAQYIPVQCASTSKLLPACLAASVEPSARTLCSGCGSAC